MKNQFTESPLILLVFANDTQQPLDEIKHEMQALETILKPVAHNLEYDIEILQYSNIDSLIKTLDDNRERLVLLHFAGHSDNEVLKLDEGEAHASGLVNKLRACQHLQLLFLNGCNNAEQVQQFIAVGIPAVIGTSTPIADTLAREFSACFYTELAERRVPVMVAFEQAKATMTTKKGDKFRTLNVRSFDLGQSDSADWSWFLEPYNSPWKLEEAAHPCNRLPKLPDKAPEQLPDSPYKNLYYYTPDDADIFFGRCQSTLDVLKHLADDRYPLLLLHGGSGVGKSSFLMAGLIPRLTARQQPVFDPIRYDEKLNLVPKKLRQALFGNDDITAIHAQLNAEGEQPTVWVLDQLEEIFFTPQTKAVDSDNDTENSLSKADQQDNIPDALNLFLKTLQALFPHDHPESWPNARIILSLRTEWFGELHDACRHYQLSSRDYLLKPLGKTDIIEVIEQPSSNALLLKKYGLQIEQLPNGRLAEQIADDLLEDKASNIAPPLQIMLSKLWQQIEHLPMDQRIWTQALYEEQKAQGLLLSEHLEQQLKEISELENDWGKRAYNSGLLLDVLHAHTTLQGTAKTLSVAEYNKFYAHVSFRDALAKNLTDRYLLVDPLNNKKQLRLAHDSLATIVKARYEISDLPGQRAQRVLHSRKADWKLIKDEHKGTALDNHDLKLVEQGEMGTRDWQQDPLETAIVQKSRKKRRNGRIVVGSVVAILTLALVATVFLYLRAEEQRLLTEEQILETNYNQAKAFEEKSIIALNEWTENQEAEAFQKAWLYALESQTKELPAGRIPALPKLLGRQAEFLGLTTERKTTSAVRLGKIRALTYSPDGKILVSASADPETRLFTTAQLWDAQTGAALITLKGHTQGIAAISYSPDNKIIATGSYDNTVKLWDAQTGQNLKTLQNHSLPVTALAYSPDGNMLASGSRDQTITLWDSTTGKILHTLKNHEGPIASLAFSPNGHTLVSGSMDSNINLWDTMNGELVGSLSGHEGGIMALAYSPDGKTLASGSQDNSVLLWDANNGDVLANLNGHSKTVFALAYSPDGKTLASGSKDQSVILWNAQSAEAIRTVKHHSQAVTALAYHPGGEIIASGSFDQTVRLWQVSDGVTLNPPQGHSQQVNVLTYSPDGKVIASGSNDDTVKLWNADDGELLTSINEHNGDVWGVAYSPDGKILATGGFDNNVHLWDTQTNSKIATLPHESEVSALVFSPDGLLLRTGQVDGTLAGWDLDTKESTGSWSIHNDAITELLYSPDGSILATASHDKTIILWDVDTGEMIDTLEGHTAAIWSLAFSPDGKLLASGSADQTIILWDMDTGEAKSILEGHNDTVVSLAFSPDGELLTSGSKDDTIRHWSPHYGEEGLVFRHDFVASALAYSPDGNVLVSADGNGKLHFHDMRTSGYTSILKGHKKAVMAVAHSPVDPVIASGSFDGSLRFWDPVTGQELASREHERIVKIAYSQDGKIIASGSMDGSIKLWDAENGELLNTLQGESEAIIAILGYNPKSIHSLSISPNGQTVTAGLGDNTIQSWDISTGEVVATLQGHTDKVYALSYSPDGHILASGSADTTIRLWNNLTGELLQTIPAHEKAVYSLAYSPDGKMLASGANDNTISLWNAVSGKLINSLHGHNSLITSLAFSPDAKVLASSSTDKTVRLWDMSNNGALLKILQGHTDAVMSLSYSPDGERLISAGKDKAIRLWNFNSPGYRLLYDFDPNKVLAALSFLWQQELQESELGELAFEHQPHPPSLMPQMGHSITFTPETQKYAPLLEAPEPSEIKINQLIEFLENSK
jgi:WD40 repeat protein